MDKNKTDEMAIFEHIVISLGGWSYTTIGINCNWDRFGWFLRSFIGEDKVQSQ